MNFYVITVQPIGGGDPTHASVKAATMNEAVYEALCRYPGTIAVDGQVQAQGAS